MVSSAQASVSHSGSSCCCCRCQLLVCVWGGGTSADGQWCASEEFFSAVQLHPATESVTRIIARTSPRSTLAPMQICVSLVGADFQGTFWPPLKAHLAAAQTPGSPAALCCACLNSQRSMCECGLPSAHNHSWAAGNSDSNSISTVAATRGGPGYIPAGLVGCGHRTGQLARTTL
jgi:hypothetical protein